MIQKSIYLTKNLWEDMFRIDGVAAAILALLVCMGAVLYRYFRFEIQEPSLSYPTVAPFKGRVKTWIERYPFIPRSLAMLALLSFALAFLDPHILEKESLRDLPPKKGLALFLALDRSGSMGTLVGQQGKTRFDVLQQAAVDLIQVLPNDLIGVVAFARAAAVISPLTLDHQRLIDEIGNLSVIKDKNQDGTSMGYALYKTAHLIVELKAFQQEDNSAYKIQKSIMIIITDGFQDPSLFDKGNRLRAMELDAAAAYAKEEGIKVYIVNVDPETINLPRYLPNRRELERAAQTTGGSLIVVDSIANLSSLLSAIPKGEMSEIYPHGRLDLVRKISFYPYLIGLGLILMGLGIALNETVWRKSL
jgi:Ca-activated chloride channel family protein